ncbi:DUF3846 domain-containing protein [Streptomyces microflavus]|uniref:DUF3846 domain-containing protein n=1 Tax=Streptomyces microflavus TaxID=1919 RepID=UPI0036AD64AA
MTTTLTALTIPPLDPQGHLTTHHGGALTLPAHGQFAWLQEQVGGLTEASYYHPDAVLHFHGNGLAKHLPLNPVAWTLASAWRGIQLPYLLAGPAVITGPEDHDGNLTPLPAPLAARTHKAIEAATEWWHENHLHLPHWPFSLDSPAFAPAINATRLAL